jgi:hypothetical protein
MAVDRDHPRGGVALKGFALPAPWPGSVEHSVRRPRTAHGGVRLDIS